MIRYRAVGAVALCALLAACGGDGGTSTPPTAAPSATPISAPTLAPAPNPTPASSQISLTGAAQTATLPSAGGVSGSVSLSSSTATNVSITETTAFTPPAGVKALAQRSQISGTVPSNAAALFYEEFTSPSAITFNGLPGFTIALPATTNMNGSFYIGVVDPTSNARVQALGPATVSGTTITFAAQPGTPLTLAANTAYAFAFYFVPNVTPTAPPSTSPSGDAVPIRTIAGANTGLASPGGIQIDTYGNLFVANSGGTITVYGPGASGNAAPLRAYHNNYFGGKFTIVK